VVLVINENSYELIFALIYIYRIYPQAMLEPYVSFKVARRDHMLEACHPYGDHGYVKMRRRRSSPIVDHGGTILKTSSSKHNQ
jgi:hypothetical protein